MSASYRLDGLGVNVTRELDHDTGSMDECYTFTNTGNESLTLNEAATEALGIYTPFNDHYTSTEDVLEHRVHAHIWANGGASSWVKLTRMGQRGPHLGLVLTEGSLGGYSVESRNVVTLSNTRGFFLLHPDLPVLKAGESSRLCWSMFWHEDWEDFFTKAARSKQFIDVRASKWTAVLGERVDLEVRSGSVSSADFENGTYASLAMEEIGEKTVTLNVGETTSRILLNVVPEIDELIASRVHFITAHQQLSPNSSYPGAYAVYDNQMEGTVTFDSFSDMNTGRERVGMGVLIARWLQSNPDQRVKESLEVYYDYVNNYLQDRSGYVYSWPIGSGRTGLRLYNFPWVMQLHLQMAKLGNKETTSGNYTARPTQRFMDTVERFYAEPKASEHYSIGLPVLESLEYFNSTGDSRIVLHLLKLFKKHGDHIAELGENYPAFEVNYEQSIVAPAAIILLELYRYTNETRWLDAAKDHFSRLLAFSGRQPDYHLHDIAIRHWDGYWFGKEKMWGDTFPHYWSVLTAVAMHHYALATGEVSYSSRAEGILRGNLALFHGGRGHCAFLYPVSVDGREGGFLDSYANDQDWALGYFLALDL